jgi:murein DD-endopeptidase MepM/ murein hydrolase activator NlpD
MIPDVSLGGVLPAGEKADPKSLQLKIESMFMETMLKSMEQTVDADDGFFGDSASSDIYRGLVRQQLATSLTSVAFKNFKTDPGAVQGDLPDTPDTTTVVAPGVGPKKPKFLTPKSIDDAVPMLPVNGVMTSPVGWRRDPFNGSEKYHKGTDYAAPAGTPVKAVADGVVIESGPKGSFGNVVVIQTDDGQRMLYGHNQANLVGVGQRVQAGDEIAQVGSTGRATGPHVHFEVLQ